MVFVAVFLGEGGTTCPALRPICFIALATHLNGYHGHADGLLTSVETAKNFAEPTLPGYCSNEHRCPNGKVPVGTESREGPKP